MKNGCIVIRNIKSYLCGEDFSGIADALADGGYFIDKMFLLSEEDEREFSQTFAECKNFFENVFVVATEEKLASLRAAAVPDDGFESCVGRDCPADASCPVTEPCVDVSCWTLPQMRSWAASRGTALKLGACFALRLMAEHAYCCLSVSLGGRRPGACSAALAPSVSFADSPIGEGAACDERNAAL